MPRIILTVCILSSLFGCIKNKKDFFAIKLKKFPDCSSFDLSSAVQNKVSVFVFLSPDCPLSVYYTLPLNDFYREYKKDSIIIYAIVAGNSITVNETDSFMRKYKIAFPVLADAKSELVKYFNATVTPETFVVDRYGTVLYKGAIDNRGFDFGRQRKTVTKFYLKNALDNIRKNTPVKLKETKAVGCIIERES